MAIKEKRQTLIRRPMLADTRLAPAAPKSAHLRGFPALPLGHRWPMAWPRQPGPVVREPGAILGPPGADSGPLHGKLAGPSSSLGPPLSIRQVAAFIGCSPWTVRQTLIPRGLPFFRSAASGRLIFYTNQVVGWIENQQAYYPGVK
jgi:hypothetical protein